MSLTMSEMRARLPAVLDQVEAGEEVTVTRHGHPVAVLIRPDLLRVRRETAATRMAEDLDRRLAKARADRVEPTAGLSVAAADELLAEVRRSREPR